MNKKYLHCEHISEKLLNEIRTEKNVILYNYAEPYSLYPYLNKGGYHKRDSRALFYHLLKEFDDTFDITFVGADIHLKQNYERLKQVVDSSLNLKIVLFPWFFVHEYFWLLCFQRHFQEWHYFLCLYHQTGTPLQRLSGSIAEQCLFSFS